MVLPNPTEVAILVVLVICVILALVARGPKLRLIAVAVCVATVVGLMIYDGSLRTPRNIVLFIVALLGAFSWALLAPSKGAKTGHKTGSKTKQESATEPLAAWLPDQQGKKYYYEIDYDKTPEALAQKILADGDLPALKHIVVGAWGGSYENNPDAILIMMIENPDKFRHIESLFIGDMEYDECEISWIIQSDRYGDLLKALPRLKTLKIKGADNLSLGDAIDHASLEELQIICGGLPETIPAQLQKAKLPNLKKLILYMGVADYGLTCTLKDLTALARRSLFPNLRELGFVNSGQQDDIVAMLLASDILPQLETLDISMGSLTDKGGRMILDARNKLTGLKNLNANYHFMSTDMMAKLQDLPFDVSTEDQQEYDDVDDIYPMVTE